MNSDKQKFDWVMVLTQLPCGLVVFLFALLLDKALISFGVAIHPWHEALYSSIGGSFFSALLVPLLWRLGLITVPQYLLGAIGLFVPCTILFLIILAQYQPLELSVNELSAAASQGREWAISMYIRIARSAVLVPVHVITFWLIFHKYLGRKHL